MEGISLELAGAACAAFLGVVVVASRNSKVDLKDLPAGSLFESEVCVTCLITGRRNGARCQCSFESSGGQSYQLWLPEDEVLRGDAFIPENGIVQPNDEGGLYFQLGHGFERPVNDRIGRIPAGAQVRHIRRFVLVALKEVREGQRLCKHYDENIAKTVDEWLPLDSRVWRASHKAARH